MAQAQFLTSNPADKTEDTQRKLIDLRFKREKHSPSRFSAYRAVWRPSQWNVFLAPCAHGFSQARDGNACVGAVSKISNKPGVYEFAISRGATGHRYKVYVGQSCDVKRRIGSEYRNSGGHLLAFFEEALEDGCHVWVRYVYTPTPDAAKDTESKLLSKYNYAWNERCNGSKRHLAIVNRCFCMTAPKVVA